MEKIKGLTSKKTAHPVARRCHLTNQVDQVDQVDQVEQVDAAAIPTDHHRQFCDVSAELSCVQCLA